MTWERSRGWFKSLGPWTHLGDWEEILGFWLLINPVPIWEMSQWMKETAPPSHCPSLALYAILPFKLNKWIFKIRLEHLNMLSLSFGAVITNRKMDDYAQQKLKSHGSDGWEALGQGKSWFHAWWGLAHFLKESSFSLCLHLMDNWQCSSLGSIIGMPLPLMNHSSPKAPFLPSH